MLKPGINGTLIWLLLGWEIVGLTGCDWAMPDIKKNPKKQNIKRFFIDFPPTLN
jgi:hypothetical protein